MTLGVEDTLFLIMAIRMLDRKPVLKLGAEVRLPFGAHQVLR